MSHLLHETLFDTAARLPDEPLVVHAKHGEMKAAEFAAETRALASHFRAQGLEPNDRVAVFLPKLPVTACAFYAASAAGGVFVPVNPVLKPAQVAYILADCEVKILVTSPERLGHLREALGACPALAHIVLTAPPTDAAQTNVPCSVWTGAGQAPSRDELPARIDNDMAAILYTSGSTGRPKGVIISHRNIVDGARSVSSYLRIDERDRILAVLPFSFDYGLNQLTSAVLKGARCVLLDYLLPKDLMKAIEMHGITGLAAVPPLWAQLARLDWPASARQTLRYFTNSGGTMPERVLARLRESLPDAAPYLMYGLTEAFRSTYLPPEKIDERRGSMGKAIPNAEILVVRPDGSATDVDEPGELVHRGALVALGYWGDPERTATRFRPAPGQPAGITVPEIAVWSGDTVKRDAEGYLYFVGRTDGMIKTSGYRVSPEEIEEVAYGLDAVESAAAVGIPHAELGQTVVLAVRRRAAATLDEAEVLAACRQALPGYMVPGHIVFRDEMPHNPNGKIDRVSLQAEYADAFAGNDP